MKERHLLLLLIFLALTFMIKESKVCFKDYCFNVEIAQTSEKRSQGLMFRKSLAHNKGMLFIFEKEGWHSFWMKNTFIPLDIIWISGKGEVVYLEKEAQPCKETCLSIKPDKGARYVLEINAGLLDKIGINLGDKAVIKK